MLSGVEEIDLSSMSRPRRFVFVESRHVLEHPLGRGWLILRYASH